MPTDAEDATDRGETDDSPDRPNVLVVCVDCLREDHLATDAADTPFLADRRARGLTATEMHATATTTTVCVASLLTGAYSERHGIQSLDTGRLSEAVRTFAERFGAAGYHTAGLVTGPLVEETGVDRGFDEYRCRDPEASLFGDWRSTVRERLANLPEPFAAYLHLWELHEDVRVPTAFDRPQYGETPYARALSALDRDLERLLSAVPENTLVAVHGDHGESITRRHSPLRLGLKSVRDAARYYGGIDTRTVVERIDRRLADRGADVPDHYLENGHGETVYDFVTNVPFVLTGPGVPSETVDVSTRQVDVLPTLLDAAGIGGDRSDAGDGSRDDDRVRDRKEGTAPMDGESLLPPASVEPRPAYLRACGASLHRKRNWARAVRADGRKYVEYPDRDWPPELYDLTADPLELDPVVDPDPGRVADLRRQFPEEDLGEGEQLDVERRLEMLGYR